MTEPAAYEKSAAQLIFGVLLAVIASPWRALRWFGRGARRRARVLLYILIVLVAVHLVATLITGVMLKRELARMRASGYLLDASQLAPKVPPGKANAADVYQKAFDARRVSKEDDEKLEDVYGKAGSEWTADQATSVRRVLSANSDYLRLAAEASRIPDCAFPGDWNAGPDMVFPYFAKLREAARMLQLRVGLASREGKIDAALYDSSAMLRTADQAKLEPILIGQLVAYALQGIAVKALQGALSAGDPSPAASAATHGTDRGHRSDGAIHPEHEGGDLAVRIARLRDGATRQGRRPGYGDRRRHGRSVAWPSVWRVRYGGFAILEPR